MNESNAHPIRVVGDGDPSVVSVVVAGKWTWLVAGVAWALLGVAVAWLASEPPVRWFACGFVTMLAVTAARMLIPRETLTLEADALVSRAGSRTTRLPLEAIDQIHREFVPKAGWNLWVGASGIGISIWPTEETLKVCRELGRRLEPRRRRIRVAEDAAAMLGWEPLGVVDEFERRRIDVVVGSAPRLAVYQALLEALEASAVQAVVGSRVVAREDQAGWREFCRAAPWPERVELRGLGRDPLAVVEPGATTIGARLTSSELAELTSALPPGGMAVPVKPTVGVRATRRFHGFVAWLVG
jgi:hypothetical protein